MDKFTAEVKPASAPPVLPSEAAVKEVVARFAALTPNQRFMALGCLFPPGPVRALAWATAEGTFDEPNWQEIIQDRLQEMLPASGWAAFEVACRTAVQSEDAPECEVPAPSGAGEATFIDAEEREQPCKKCGQSKPAAAFVYHQKKKWRTCHDCCKKALRLKQQQRKARLYREHPEISAANKDAIEARRRERARRTEERRASARQNCIGCGKEFWHPRKNRKFCSATCQRATNRRPVEKTCEACGTLFSRPAWKAVVQRFCGRPCMMRFWTCSGHLAEKRSLGYRTDIESYAEAVLKALQIPYIFEYQVEHYSIDFALPVIGVALECDGWAHQLPGRAAKDQRRDIDLQTKGWTVVRLVDAELRRNPQEAIVKALSPYLAGESGVKAGVVFPSIEITQTKRVCRACSISLDLIQFSPMGIGKWHRDCRSCRAAQAREARKRASKGWTYPHHAGESCL